MTKLLLSAALLAAIAAAGQYQVTINTSAFSGQPGTIDIQFNPGSFPGAFSAGTATVTSFVLTGGSLGSIAAGPDGGASGALPGPLVIANSDFLNGIFYNAVFGSQISFLVDFTGAAFTGPGQAILTDFSVALTPATGGAAAVASLTGNSQLNTGASSGTAQFTPVATAIPEPSALGLLTMGVGLVAIFRARRPLAPRRP